MKYINSSEAGYATWHPYFDEVDRLARKAGYDLYVNGYQPTLSASHPEWPMPEISVEISYDFDNRPGVIAFWPTMTFPVLDDTLGGTGGHYASILQQWERASKLCDYLYEHLLVPSEWED